MASTTKGNVRTIHLEKFLLDPSETVQAACAKKQTLVTDDDGKPRLLVGTNCLARFEIPQLDEADELEDAAPIVDRGKWLR